MLLGLISNKGNAMNKQILEVDFELTEHAQVQMSRRGISESHVSMVIGFGRKIYNKGAKKYIVGKKEVQNASKQGVDIQQILDIHVICCTDQNTVITVFRNKNFKKNLKKRRKNYDNICRNLQHKNRCT